MNLGHELAIHCSDRLFQRVAGWEEVTNHKRRRQWYT